ncbi:hypothetical protein B0O80DRAFT_500155 [Mortierella sp. GBAus27b]|nr:hypothetical protein B0O80DRAFT_500155 [Mortierella sp. GBAus27b]
MKSSPFVLACLSLLLVAQKAIANPSSPVENCRTDCYTFAEKYGITFDDLLRWNNGLHKNCDNLDAGNDICVLGPDETPKDITSDPPATISAPSPMDPHTAGAQDSPTSVPAAPSKTHPATTPSKAATQKSGTNHAPAPAPAAHDPKLPEATPKSHEVKDRPIGTGRALYPNIIPQVL